MDDMQSYFERRGFLQVKTVLDDMKKQDVIGGLRQIGDDLRARRGWQSPSASSGRTRSTAGPRTSSIPRLAAPVPARSRGAACPRQSCSRCSRSSRARSTCARRPASRSRPGPHSRSRTTQQQAGKLSGTRRACASGSIGSPIGSAAARLGGRVQPRDPPAERSLGGHERRDHHPGPTRDGRPRDRRRDRGDRAAPAVAPDQSARRRGRRFVAGGGGTGKTHDSALALVGGGLTRRKCARIAASLRPTGDAGPTLPEEFRAGLDEYFKRLETRPRGE